MTARTKNVRGDGFAPVKASRCGVKVCRFCSAEYEATDWRSEFCSKECKRSHHVFWQSKGPALAKLLHAYRVERKDGALSDLCAKFADDLDDFQRKRGAAI